LQPRNFIPTALCGVTLLCAMAAVAQNIPGPYVNIDPNRHGNLAAAQDFIVQAYNRIGDAQRANHGQLEGHAAHAKQLLAQANEELRLAADVANEHQDEQQYQNGPPQ
jgi:hypothetical protein